MVVICPPLAARSAGKGNQFKLHANDQIVAENRQGTYSFAYLDPGKYGWFHKRRMPKASKWN